LLVALAPCDEFSATLELRFTLEGELERLAIQTDHEAALRLAYFAALVPLDELAGYLPDIAVAGTIGSEGSSDTGVGTGVPVLVGGGQISRFRFEITAAVEDRSDRALWSGRPAGAAEFYTFRSVVRTVAPLLLERLGTTDARVPFSARAY